MSNLATILKSEILRLASKQVRSETESLRKSLANLRRDLAASKKRIRELEAAGARARKAAIRAKPDADAKKGQDAVKLRFRAAGLASNRKRLGLSAADVGALVGATGQSILSWEKGTSRPRQGYLGPIAELRNIGKREAARRLAALRGEQAAS